MSLTAFICAAALVVDGDTLRCRNVPREYVRLARIQAADHPRSRPCQQHRPGYVCDARRYAVAKGSLAQMVSTGPVRCHVVDASPLKRGFQQTDGYRRPVARCTVAGVDLSAEQLRRGMAEVWP